MSRLTGFVFAACVIAAGLTVPASAMPVTWTLNSVAFDDGATASGTFVYDADTNTVGAVNITTTSGAIVSGATYTMVNPGYGPFPQFIVVVTGTFADFTGTPALALGFDVPLTDGGGNIPLALLGLNRGGEFVCGNAGCSFGIETRAFVSGSVSAPVIPEPATISMLMMGLFGLGRARRARAR